MKIINFYDKQLYYDITVKYKQSQVLKNSSMTF